jgi:predicted Zn-dependent protease with MMP-like domain
VADTRHQPFEVLVERALAGLPPQAQRLLENVAIVIADEPTDSDDGTDLYGLYEGIALTEYGADSVPYANKITLFRLPLEEDFPDPD